MNTSFYTGISALKTEQFGLDVWGDNIANINTVGFRASTPEFSTLLSQAKAQIQTAGMDGVGLGATGQTTALNLSDGNYQTTDRSLDLAISGDGWFGVKKAGSDTLYFTRAGDFSVDANGNLLNGAGDNVVGSYTGTMTINKTGSSGSVSSTATVPANVLTTPEKQVALQLPTYLTNPGKAGTPAVTSNLTSYTVAMTSGTSTDITYSLPIDTTATLKILDSNGNVVKTVNQSTQSSGDKTYTWDGKDDSGNQLPSGTYTVTGTYVSQPAVAAIGTGTLTGYQVDESGNVIAGFSNGMSTVVAQIPLFHFQNDQGLEKVGDNEFAASDNSGKAIFFKDSSGNVIQGGVIHGSTLETSNVSAATALTELIVTQRAYDAGSKILTTSDQMIQKAINMKT